MFKNLFDSTRKQLKAYRVIADQVMLLADEMKQLKDEDFPVRTEKLKSRALEGESLDDVLVEAFALVREAATRHVKMTPYYVQILGGIAIHKGNIAEMRTGEGKTLTAVMPAYLNALAGNGVHIVTVNEYLAGREAHGEIGSLFRFLGLTVGLNIRELTSAQKKEAYACDVMYSTNSELGFDYLRDHMALYSDDIVAKKGLNYAIIDEVDSILIDEARTPLIISGPAKQAQSLYMLADRFVKSLNETQYEIDLESNTIELTEDGISKAESVFKVDNLYDVKYVTLLHHIHNALRANYIMHKDKEYMVLDGEILIIDQFTGRILKGRQFSEGLHQAIEAKEGVEVKKETVTVATITYQNFFRMYNKLSGMTGTAKTEEDEFRDIYNMEVVEIPTNMPIIRHDDKDVFFVSTDDKLNALLDDVEQRHKLGQPILIGTIAVESSEQISFLLRKRRILHEVLNAKNHEREAEIIAKAGLKGSVTIATNMAGRGTDIKLGEGVVELGGLAVLGSEKHEARRIDNQLRGRAGRQGDPGYSRFYISGDDELLIRRGGDRFRSAISMLTRAHDDGQPVTSKMISNVILGAQKRSESTNAEIRKNVLKYDDVLRIQRELIYRQRTEVLQFDSMEEKVKGFMNIILVEDLQPYFKEISRNQFEIDDDGIISHYELNYFGKNTMSKELLETHDETTMADFILSLANAELERKKEGVPPQVYQEFLKVIMLRVIDTHWMKHIDTMAELRQSVRLQAYGQNNPLVLYQQEGKRLFDDMTYAIAKDITRYALLGRIQMNVQREAVVKNTATNDGKQDLAKKDRVRKIRGKQKPWQR